MAHGATLDLGLRNRAASALRMALESLLAPSDRDATTAPRRLERPVLLLHGLASTPRTLIAVERVVRRQLGRPVVSLNLGLGLRDIRDSADRVFARLELLARESAFQYADAVGHSMGGLVATYLLKCLDHGRHLRRIVALATPFGGVRPAAARAALFGGWATSLRQMRPDSRFLRQLATIPLPERCGLVSIGAELDPLVSVESSRAAGAAHVVVPGANHWTLLMASDAHEAIREALAGERS